MIEAISIKSYIMTKSKFLNLIIVFSLTVSAIVMSFGRSSNVQASSDNNIQYGKIAAVITVPIGGSYSSVRNSGTGGQVHHMPAFKSFNGLVELTYGKGPAIWMETADHRATLSCGSSNTAKDHRTKQIALIKQNKFEEAMNLDIADVQSLFPGKYDAAIKQAKAYYLTIKPLTAPKVVAPDTTTPDNSCSL
jgi:hypothetical protein